MESEEIKKIIKDTLMQNNYGIKMPVDFAVNESLFLHGVIDSFGIFPFINELQVRFNINIKDSEIRPGNLETIENIATFIYNKKNERTEKK
jgi:acyl carrier protein